MTEAELTTDLRLASQVGPNVITNIEDAVGLYARRDIYQGETLTTDSLVRDPRQIALEEYGPSSLIPQGWVAMAVPMDRLSGVSYGLAPGDSIDVMLSFSLSAIDEEFQTLLNNSVTFYLESSASGAEGDEGPARPSIFVIDPYGRFENLPTGDTAHIVPSETFQRPVPIAVILQNARVIQVGAWTPREPAREPTPTPDPNAPTPTPSGIPPTPTPSAPNVLLVALPPQQQLFLKYALETTADIDFALRGVNDGQLYTVQNVDLNYLLQQFNIVVPPNYNFTAGGLVTTTLEIEELGGQ
jgi:Flp pilus assembly protein CpaB